MPRPSLPEEFKFVRSMEVLLTKHTLDDVWFHFSNVFDTYDEKARYFTDKLNNQIVLFLEKKPYNNIDWKRNHKTGHARHIRINTTMWNGYDEEECDKYNKLWQVGRDLRLLKNFYDKKDEYERYTNVYTYFCDTMRSLQDEYKKIEQREWDCSYAQWKVDDAEWIEKYEAYKQHKSFHKTVEEQERRMREATCPIDREAIKSGRWVSVNYELEHNCIHCKEERIDKERRDKALADQEIEMARKNEEWRQKQEALCQAELDARNKERENAPAYTCKECEFATKHSYIYDTHIDSKEHKARVRAKSLYCAVCDHMARHPAEFEAHLHSKKHKKMCSK